MKHLTRESLHSLEEYAELRPQFRESAIAEKKRRSVFLGEHVQLQFESKLTMQYQVQEMLRIEKIFEAAGIEEELSAYNPLIPDGDNWKATMYIQYEDVDVRREKLVELKDIENQLWAQAGDSDKIFAIADEDMDRADETKTSAVHFLRFQLPSEFIAQVKAGKPIAFGTNHPHYSEVVDAVEEPTRESLAADLN